MEGCSSDFNRALAIVRNAKLPHPDGQLLESFLAYDHGYSSSYMLSKCSTSVDMAAFLSDWKELIAMFFCEDPIRQVLDKRIVADIKRRDGGRCCITGLGNSFLDPLVVVPIFLGIGSRIDVSLHEMLGAFLGPELRDWVLAGTASQTIHRNCWLVRKSAATAWSQGFFEFSFSKSSECFVAATIIRGPGLPPIAEKLLSLRYTSLKDHSASGMDTPDVFALKVISRFAKAIRWSCVAREIAQKISRAPSKPYPTSRQRFLFTERLTTALLVAWRRVPTSLRIQAYRALAILGAYIYGSNCSMKVQQLPFGMYLKSTSTEWHEGLANEYGALELVRSHTHIPVPRPLDLVSNSRDSYLLTSRVPGHRLGACIDALDDQEASTLIRDLQRCLVELRAIPKTCAPEYAITNALGNACYDHRINAALNYDEDRGDFVGPFVDEEEFNKTLRCGALPDVVHRSGHKIVFTHGDLNMRNVLVHNGRFSGIVDWENSGWYPDYWDYTKAHFVTKLKWRWLNMVDDACKELGDFEDALQTERQLWQYCF
ncbi:hypothetical protein TOPH_07654 [Tolypocladium ophioglossoides CBS 100239]|uniref:Aminoglycoside phosphotransferase domain-containing protein n=1 Tax=Tolypocladium ophioglossoides (strain CBS 100239) TaxID=1163406 RepID=A0A0L0N1K5_TOLOC|nr:hypothetical protein TOPH_07654 [Tolypocladium ophioglossoides CBS 100239]